MTITENKASTRRTIEGARKSFETITGKRLKKGVTTLADIEQWLNGLREMGRSIGTCRTYLSFINQLAGLEMELPQRGKAKKAGRTLSDVELKAMLGIVNHDFYALVASLCLNSPSVLNETWGTVSDPTRLDISIPAKLILINEAKRRGHDAHTLMSFGKSAHWVNGVDQDEIIFPYSPHDLNRRLKTLARKAGISDKDVNLTAIKSAHKRLMKEYLDADQIVTALGIKVAVQKVLPPKQFKQLHGIGRRSTLIKSA